MEMKKTGLAGKSEKADIKRKGMDSKDIKKYLESAQNEDNKKVMMIVN